MNRVCWTADKFGRYWLDVALAGRPAQLMLDTGLVDPAGDVGLELDPLLYDAHERSGAINLVTDRKRRDSSGRSFKSKAGLIMAQLYSTTSRAPVGPAMQLFAFRGSPNVPSRVGAVFFHRLTGCRVDWDLDNRVWCVEYP